MVIKRKKMLGSKMGAIQRKYTRKAQKGVEPNDRKYDKKFEKIVKLLDPEALSVLLHGEPSEENE